MELSFCPPEMSSEAALAASSDGHSGASAEDAGDVLTSGCEWICPSAGHQILLFVSAPNLWDPGGYFSKYIWGKKKRLGNVSRLLVVPIGLKYWRQMNTTWVVDEHPAPLPFLGKRGLVQAPEGTVVGAHPAVGASSCHQPWCCRLSPLELFPSCWNFW